VSRSAEGAAAADPGQDPPWLGEVRSPKGQGNAILGIKRVREVTGWGLKEAKDYVDAL
jgi:ribosomal protein L7/L12